MGQHMHCARGAQGPGGCMEGEGEAVSACPRVFTPLQVATPQGLHSDTPSKLPPVPCQKWVVKGRGTGSPAAPGLSAVLGLKPRVPQS